MECRSNQKKKIVVLPPASGVVLNRQVGRARGQCPLMLKGRKKIQFAAFIKLSFLRFKRSSIHTSLSETTQNSLQNFDVTARLIG
jgi:hypothetical protein